MALFVISVLLVIVFSLYLSVSIKGPGEGEDRNPVLSIGSVGPVKVVRTFLLGLFSLLIVASMILWQLKEVLDRLPAPVSS